MTALSPEQMLFDMLSEEIERIDPANAVLARARRLALRLPHWSRQTAPAKGEAPEAHSVASREAA